MRVLVIEDHPSQLKLANLVLSAAGHSVSAAEAAEKALAAIQQDKPEVILLDMALPGMDGLTFVKKLKKDPETQNICVIAVTSFPEHFSKNAALAAGCDAYIEKPISPRTLPGDIQDVFTRKSA